MRPGLFAKFVDVKYSKLNKVCLLTACIYNLVFMAVDLALD